MSGSGKFGEPGSGANKQPTVLVPVTTTHVMTFPSNAQSSSDTSSGFPLGSNLPQFAGATSMSASNNSKGFSFDSVSTASTFGSVSQTTATEGKQIAATPALSFGKVSTQSAVGSALLGASSALPLSSGLKLGTTTPALSQSSISEQQKSGTSSGLAFGQHLKPALSTQAPLATTQSTSTDNISIIKTSFPTSSTASTQSFSQFAVRSTNDSTTSQNSTSSTAAVGMQKKNLTYKQLEDIINKWVHELEDQERVFLNQANQVNTWDRLLIDNGENITQLNAEIQRLKTDQSSLDRELDYILSKQQELEEMLIPLEEQMKVQQTVQYMQHADVERERTYKMAENIDCQLKRMMQDLKDIINHINSSNLYLRDSEDPMAHIAKILNSHMDSLQWIDHHSILLQRRVEDVSRQVENRKREHERSLRLTFT